MTLNDVAMMTLIRPFILGFREPIVFAWNIYLGLTYGAPPRCVDQSYADSITLLGILYCFISSLGIVFIEKHGFNLGQNGLAFLVSIDDYYHTSIPTESELAGHYCRCHRLLPRFPALGIIRPQTQVQEWQ